MGIQKIEVETEVKCHAQKMYHMIKHNLHDLPKIHPEAYKGSEICKGDGTKNGCVRTWNYVLPGSSEVLHVRCQNEDVDDKNMTIGLKAIEGDELKNFNHLLARILVTPKGNGCVVKWTVEFEKKTEDVPDPYKYLELFSGVNEKLDSHLLNE